MAKRGKKKITPKTLANRIILSWPCLSGKPLNPKGRPESKKKKPAKCYLKRKSSAN